MVANPRKAAADIIYSVFRNSSFLSSEIEKCRSKSIFSNTDIRFISELVNGTVRKKEFLDYAISAASNVKLNKISPYVLCVLRTGAYQILFMDKVPDSAAVNESVSLVKKMPNRHIAGFVNAVLRKVSANGRNLILPKEKNIGLSVKYSCPLWLVNRWIKQFGDDTEELLEAMNQKPETVLRVNTLKTSSDSLISVLSSDGWECKRYEHSIFDDDNELISAARVEDMSASKAYADGLFYVQDAAASYAARVLAPSEGETVIDMCAAPGGKTTHMSQIMKNTGKIYAFDIYDIKTDRINENAQRLGITNIIAKKCDSSVFMPEYKEKADKILVDAPCSGLGIIRRKPDIKYLRKESDIFSLSALSRSILENAAKYLKPGGRMVFSTCTLEYEENEGVLFAFLRAHPEFKLVKIKCNRKNEGFITLYPHRDRCDGFFISLLEKEKDND